MLWRKVGEILPLVKKRFCFVSLLKMSVVRGNQCTFQRTAFIIRVYGAPCDSDPEPQFAGQSAQNRVLKVPSSGSIVVVFCVGM